MNLRSEPVGALSASPILHIRTVDPRRISSARLDQLLAILDEDERARAALMIREADRRAFTVAHGVLREMLSAQSGAAPEDWRFVKETFGRPVLSEIHSSALCFSLTHLPAIVSCAVSDGVPVGIDAVTPLPFSDIPREVLTPSESRFIAALSEQQVSENFAAIFACKEAVLKLIGTGFHVPPTAVEISLSGNGLWGASREGIPMDEVGMLRVFPVGVHQLAVAAGMSLNVRFEQNADRM